MIDKRFSFEIVKEDIVRKEMMNLDGAKATPNGDISVNFLKLTADICLPYKINIINLSIEEGVFFDELKLAEVRPIFKKKNDFDRENYGPASVLPQVSKLFERIMHHQINGFMTDKLSKQLRGFRKNHSAFLCWKCVRRY